MPLKTMSTPAIARYAKNIKNLTCLLAFFIAILSSATILRAATIVWSGASGVDSNWSTGANWVNTTAPGSADDVKFYDLDNVATVSNINNVVDLSFPGTIGSLQYGNTNGFHTTSITNGETLNLTGANGLTAGTLTDNGSAQIVNATITGAGALNLNNTAANIVVDQGRAANGNGTQRAILDMSGLASFTANFNAMSVGATMFGGGNNVQNTTGTLKLAQTNVITTFQIGTAITGSAGNQSTPTNSIEIGANNGNAGGADFLFLGKSNEFFIDSIGVGTLKTTASMLFNTGLNNPVAYFRGPGGDPNRIRFWTIADMSSSGSSSGNCNGTNDFSGGTVDILADTMSLGRDRQGGNTGTSVTKGTLTFTAGIIDVNTIYIGNQQWTNTSNSNPMAGVVNVGGVNALLRVNSTLFLGRTSTNNTAALKTVGTLNITNGTVLANNISVGTYSSTNFINMVNGTLIVSNTLATNASGLFSLSMSNSTLGLNVTAGGPLDALVKTLNVSGPTNFIQLGLVAVFNSYPATIPLIQYTALSGAFNFGLANTVPSGPGAYLTNLTTTPSSVALVLPIDPRPVITGQPASYAGSPGDNVTFNVTVSPNSVTPLSYQWFYVSGGVTNQLSDGSGPSGGSTLSGSTTASLSVMNAQPGDSGSYFAVVANVYGSAASASAALEISTGDIAPSITGPNNQTVIQGNNATFSASPIGKPIPTVQWQSNSVDIPDATNTTLVVSNAQYATENGTVYSIIASNEAGNATNSAILNIIVAPVITNQPVNLVVTNTQPASFTVVAGGVEAPTYQWYKNSLANPILNATNPTFSIAHASPSDTATYFVKLVNSAGPATSSNATLTVNSLMAAVSFSPNNGQSGVCYDTPLSVVFNTAPTLNNIGTIKIYNVNNPSTPVDTLDLTAGSPQPRTIAGTVFNSFPVITTNNTAIIYPHLDMLTSNQTYYVTIDDGVFKDSSGAYFAGITATNAWQFTTKPGGPVDPLNPVVAADGSGDFVTVQGALDSLPATSSSLRVIHINNGNYVEIVNGVKSNLTIRGQSRAGTVVGYNNNNNMNPSTGTRMAFRVNASAVSIENLTIVNTTPQGGSQAEALMVDAGGSQFILNNAEVDSRQDTILVNSATTQAYFNNNLIQGNFDYIWGGGNLFVTNCEIRTIAGTGTPNLAAPRTPNGPTGNWPGYQGNMVSNGFSFVECRLTVLPGVTNCSMSDHNGATNGQVAYIDCSIDLTGYTNADATARASQLLWEFGCSNLNNTLALDNTASPFLSFTQLNNGDATLLAAENAVTWLNGWSPALAPNILTQPTNVTVNANQPASFTVGATGVPNPTYQWLKNGTNLSGQTSATLTIPNATGFDIGSYAVIVSNGSGSVTSSVVTLNVIPPTSGPTLLTPQVQNDGAVQFTISGQPGSAGFSYRVWTTTNLASTPITNTWTLLTNDVFQSTPTTFTDATATGSPQRFYIITVP